MALGTGLSFQYWDTSANKTKRIAVDDSATSNVGRFYQAQVRQLYTGGNGALNLKSSTDDDLAVFNDDGSVSIGVSGQDTTIAGNLVVTGNVTVNGTTTTVSSTEITIADNVIFVNSGPAASKNAGYASERYQAANQTGTGDVVDDSACLVVTIADIGDQTGMTNVQVYLNTGASATDDYYVGMWIKTAVDNNVRKITAYTGTTKIATVASAWSVQPASNAALSIYTPFQGLIWNETDNRFVMARLAGSAANNAILDHVDFTAGTLRADDGIYSTNGIILNSGTAANNVVKSSGGDLIVSGGMGAGGLSLRTNNGGSANGLDIAGTSITSYQPIIASSDSSKDLGSSTVAWRDLYVDRVTSLDANGYVQLGSATIAARLPNQNDTEQGALAAVAAGCLVWNTTDSEVQVYNGSAWVTLGGDPAQAGTTNLSWTVNSDGGGSADEDAALVLVSDDGSNKDTGTLTYVAGTLGGSNRADYGTWLFSAAVKLVDDKALVLGTGNDVDLSWNNTGSFLDFNVAGAVQLDASGSIAVESSGGAISIGADDIDQAINIGTDGERALTLGSTNGAAGLVFNAGTGLIDINATVKFSFAADFCFDGFTIDGGLASGEFAYISANDTLAEATAASGGHCDLIEGVYNGTGLVTHGPVTIKKPSGEVWAAGDRVFVNNAASGGTTTAPSASGTDVREIGRVITAAGNGTTTARILLDLTKDTVSNP